MAEEFLQGVQIGSNLFDRAQTQRRLQEQAQLQLGHLAIQQQQADMQQKMQQLALSDAIEEKRFQAEDTPQYYQFQRDVQNYLSNPSAEAPLPSVPQFRSKAFRAEGDATLKQLSQFSNRAVAMKQMETTRQLLTQAAQTAHKAFNDEVEFGLTHGGTGFLEILDKLPNQGLTPNGTVDPKALSTLRAFNSPLRQQVEQRKQALEKASLARTEQTIRGGVGETKVENGINALAEVALVDKTDPKQVAEARPWVLGTAKTTAKDADIVNNGDQAVASLTAALDAVKQFDSKYKNVKFQDFVGPYDNPVFKAQGLLKSQQTSAQKEASGILQTFKDAVSNYRKGLYGATLTPNEQKELEEVVSTAKRGDYVNALDNFNSILKRNVGTAIRRNRYSPSFTPELKRQYAPDIFVGETTVETPSGGAATTVVQEPVLPAGWKFTR